MRERVPARRSRPAPTAASAPPRCRSASRLRRRPDGGGDQLGHRAGRPPCPWRRTIRGADEQRVHARAPPRSRPPTGAAGALDLRDEHHLSWPKRRYSARSTCPRRRRGSSSRRLGRPAAGSGTARAAASACSTVSMCGSMMPFRRPASSTRWAMPPSSAGTRTIGATPDGRAVPIEPVRCLQVHRGVLQVDDDEVEAGSASSSTLSITGSFTHVPRAGPPGRASGGRNRLVRGRRSWRRVVGRVEDPAGRAEKSWRGGEKMSISCWCGPCPGSCATVGGRDDGERRRPDRGRLLGPPLASSRGPRDIGCGARLPLTPRDSCSKSSWKCGESLCGSRGAGSSARKFTIRFVVRKIRPNRPSAIGRLGEPVDAQPEAVHGSGHGTSGAQRGSGSAYAPR